MDEDVTDQTAGAPQSGPPAAAGGGTVVEAFPGELGAGGAIARAVAHVEIGFDGEKRKFTGVLTTEGNVRRPQASSPNASDFFAGRGFPRYRRLMFCYDPSRYLPTMVEGGNRSRLGECGVVA